ncbi:MAG TPA: metallophosphoesterase family protein [Myxococcales bacterium LLY-WYZ-16_1]|jgi:predicted phosphodiesterase|nr:metallophosphoesterase family protein [Myxococcales bacterium LLY-WYZ-16_1]
MRLALFSDVHGNIEALEAVLERFEEVGGIDRYCCLGDIVGYGAEPEACCTRIREIADVTLLGNHDAAVAGRMDYSYYYDAAREALDWCRERLSPKNLEWLERLPYTHRIHEEVDLSHGSPHQPEEYDYVFSAEQAQDLLGLKEDLAKVTFIGHSHLTKVFAVSEESALDVVAPRFSLKPQFKYVVTVGSVGQPRDYDPRACAGIYDTETRTFEYLRVEYDVESQRQKILDAGLAENFGTRLLLGI